MRGCYSRSEHWPNNNGQWSTSELTNSVWLEAPEEKHSVNSSSLSGSFQLPWRSLVLTKGLSGKQWAEHQQNWPPYCLKLWFMDHWIFFFVPFTEGTADKSGNNSQIRAVICHVLEMCSVLKLLSSVILPGSPGPVTTPPDNVIAHGSCPGEIREMCFYKPCADLTYGSTHSEPPQRPTQVSEIHGQFQYQCSSCFSQDVSMPREGVSTILKNKGLMLF